MNYTLPTSVEIDGTSYEIRTDFRVVLDICYVLDDHELSDYEKKVCIVEMFYSWRRQEATTTRYR